MRSYYLHVLFGFSCVSVCCCLKAAEGPGEHGPVLPLLCDEADNEGSHTAGLGHVSLTSHMFLGYLEPRAKALPSPASQAAVPGDRCFSALMDVASMNVPKLLLMSFWPPWFAVFWNTGVWAQVEDESCSQTSPRAASSDGSLL